MAIALAELPPNDWSALMISDRFDVTAGQAGLGFVAVAGGMLVGRVVGDLRDRPVRPRAHAPGGRRAGRASACCSRRRRPHPALAGAGLFVAGLGLSSLFPLLFRAASDLTHGSHSGMASFSSGARLGFLLASPLMGFVAERHVDRRRRCCSWPAPRPPSSPSADCHAPPSRELEPDPL